MSRLLALGLFVVAFVLVAIISAVPWVSPDKPGIAVLLCTIAGFALLGRGAWRSRHWTFWLVPVAAVLLVPAVVLSRSFRRIDMLAIVFHKDFGMQGATLAGLEQPVLQGVSCGLGMVLIFVGLGCFGRWRGGHFVAAALVILGINPVIQFLVLSQLKTAVPSDLSQKLVQPVLKPLAAGGVDPDILMIYMESTDRQFADPAVWGDVYAPLNDFAAQGMTFTNVGQIAGTGWSLAGVVATNCGVPIMPRGALYRTAFEQIDTFMPSMTCLGDVIATRGYDAAYVVGGDLGFGGLRVLFHTHQIPDATGRRYLMQRAGLNLKRCIRKSKSPRR